jgi:hypothetical protein
VRGRSRLLLWAAGAIVGVAAEWVALGWSRPGRWLPDLVTGWTLIGCGLAGWSVRPGSRSGPLMAATGFTWFAGNFGAAAIFLYRGPLVQLVLSYPGGKLAPGRVRAAVAVGYGAAVVPAVWRSEVATIVLSLLLVGVAGAVHAGAVGRRRRASGYALRATTFLAVVLAGIAGVRLAVPTQVATDATLLAYQAALCVLAAALLAGLARRDIDSSGACFRALVGRSGVRRPTAAARRRGCRVNGGVVRSGGEPARYGREVHRVGS